METAIVLVPGENLIRTIAVGRGGVEGPPATRTVPGPGAPSRPNLNVVAIGINDYANPAWELFYPRNDARTLVSILRDRGARLHGPEKDVVFNEVRAATLLDSAARKDAIEGLLLQSSAAANDILVVHFSGHGYALREGEGWDWYLLPWTREWRRRTDSTLMVPSPSCRGGNRRQRPALRSADRRPVHGQASPPASARRANGDGGVAGRSAARVEKPHRVS